jgi:hypothetical protein
VVIAHEQAIDAIYKVVNITKAPRLATVTKNGKVFTSQSLANKSR